MFFVPKNVGKLYAIVFALKMIENLFENILAPQLGKEGNIDEKHNVFTQTGKHIYRKHNVSATMLPKVDKQRNLDIGSITFPQQCFPRRAKTKTLIRNMLSLKCLPRWTNSPNLKHWFGEFFQSFKSLNNFSI